MQSPVAPGWVREQLPGVAARRAGGLRRRCSPTSTGSSSRASRTGSTRGGTPTSRRARPGRRCSPTSCRRASACRGCSGRRRRRAPSWRRTSSTGWPSCSGCPTRFRSDGAGGGVIEESASGATLCALLAARWRAAGDGPFDHLRAYTSTQAHSSIEKAVRIAGLRPDQLRHDRRRRRLRAAARTRWPPRWPRTAPPASRPFFVVANVGTTSSTALDPLPPIADAVRGARRVAPRRRRPRRVGAGVPRAAVDRRRRRPSRQLLHEPAQVAVHQLRLRLLLGGRPDGAHRRADRAARVPAQRGQRVGRGDRLPRLAGAARPAVPAPQAVVRAARLRRRGASAPRPRARRAHAGAGRPPRTRTRASRWWHRTRSTSCASATSTATPPREALLDALNATGRVLLTHTRLDDRFVIRVSIGAQATEARHVDALWALIEEHA